MRFSSSLAALAGLTLISGVSAQGSLDTTALAAAASSAVGEVDPGLSLDTGSIAAAATSALAGGTSGLGDAISAAQSWADGASVPTAVASLTSEYGGLLSSALSNPAAVLPSAQGLLSSALGNADVSSYIANNPQLSSLVGQATGLLGDSSASGSSNAGSVEDNGSGARPLTAGLAVVAGVLAGAIAALH
ncbi:hypothetical protein JCM10449v2_005265 [Rhodotorula kratochvilovae]